MRSSAITANTAVNLSVSTTAVLTRNVVSGADSIDTLNGTAGADELFAYGQADLVSAGDGTDTLWGGGATIP